MNKNKLAELGIFKDRQDGTLKNVYKSIDSNEIIEMTLVPNKENTKIQMYSVFQRIIFAVWDARCVT